MKISFDVSLFLYPKMEFVFEMKVLKVAKLSHFPVKISRFLGRCSCVQQVKDNFQAWFRRLSVHQSVFYHTVILFYKIRQNSAPPVLFNMAHAEYAYSTRAKAKGSYKVLSSIRVPSSLAVQSFRWRSVQFWNMVPSEIKSIYSMVKFKKSLKLWTTENIGINPQICGISSIVTKDYYLDMEV